MKYILLLLLLATYSIRIHSQVFQEHIINVETDGSASNNAVSTYAADIDGDGDMDVLSASWGINNIAWYKNDGQGNFGSQHVISTNADGGNSVFAIDLDGDMDIDVLSASTDNKIAWYPNDGKGNFGPQEIISIDAFEANTVFAIDLDNNGTIDVLSASEYDDKIAWYKNDGHGNFSNEKIISTNAIGAVDVYAIDLDNDKAIDVLSASKEDGKILWYKNNGLGDFSTPKLINPNATGAMSVYASDIDGDGNIDVISASSASFDEGLIAWYKNDGSGSFSSAKIISTFSHRPYSVYAIDIDADNDIDVLSASDDGTVVWYMNTNGMGSFGSANVLTTDFSDHARDVFAVDLDGDTDMDILSATWLDDQISWYENPQITTSVDKANPLQITIFPVPTGNWLSILYDKEIAHVDIYNQLGDLLIRSFKQNEMDVSILSMGIYYVKITDIHGVCVTQKIVKM